MDLSTQKKLHDLLKQNLPNEKKIQMTAIMESFNISKSTYFRHYSLVKERVSNEYCRQHPSVATVNQVDELLNSRKKSRLEIFSNDPHIVDSKNKSICHS
jgi:hypothetical protein